MSAALKVSIEPQSALVIQWAVSAMNGRRLESDQRSDVKETLPWVA